MSSIEQSNGIHSRERSQVDRSKTTAEQYAEHCKIDYSLCDSDKIEDRGRGVVKVLEG